MPRYYFETDDEDERYHDEEGTELNGPDVARKEALAALPDMARDKIQTRDRRTFRSTVRDTDGQVVFEGKLILEGSWYATPSSHRL